MLRIALCDDDHEYLTFLSTTITTYLQQRNDAPEYSLESYYNGMDLLTAHAKARCDVLLLDIHMPLADGMEIAKEIRSTDKIVKIIFLTSTPSFALESYDVKAYAYLLKDAPLEKIYNVLDDILAETETTERNATILKTRTGLIKIHFHNIEFVEVNGKNITIQMSDGKTHELFGTLSELENMLLAQEGFIKTHRSYIINMEHVRKLHEKELKTMGGYIVPISKANYPEIKRRYLEYSFKHGD